MEALIELQALRLLRAVELCKTFAERSLGGDVYGALLEAPLKALLKALLKVLM
jgi:hypothetical protein